jgi:hypothetical protein
VRVGHLLHQDHAVDRSRFCHPSLRRSPGNAWRVGYRGFPGLVAAGRRGTGGDGRGSGEGYPDTRAGRRVSSRAARKGS